MKAAWSGRTESSVSFEDSRPPQGYETLAAGRRLPVLTLKCGVPEKSTCNCASLSVSIFSVSGVSGLGVAFDSEAFVGSSTEAGFSSRDRGRSRGAWAGLVTSWAAWGDSDSLAISSFCWTRTLVKDG